MSKLKWKTHADLAIRKNPTVGREVYLDHMTFRLNAGPMFTEIFGPLVGLKEEWEEQGASSEELDFSELAPCGISVFGACHFLVSRGYSENPPVVL